MAKKFGYECPEFKGEELEVPNRATSRNINKSMARDFWRGENVVYEIEREAIQRQMEIMLDSLLRKYRDSKVEAGEVENLWESLKKQITGYYQKEEDSKRLTPKKESYVKKNLRKGYGLGVAFNILLWIAIVLEIVVLVAQTIAISFSEGGYIDYPSIIVAFFMGILLAVGGWLVGIFLSVWWFDNELDRNGIAEEHMRPAHWFFLIMGIVLIVFVAMLRFFAGGGVYALILTLILGFLVAILKAFKDYFDGMRCFVGSLRMDYFKKEASRLHEDRIKEYRQTFYDTVEKLKSKYNVEVVQYKEGTA